MRVLAAFGVALVCITAAAADLPRIFMTSTSGTGDLSTWPDAHGFAGLAAADEICRTRAAASSLSGADDYVALLSDSLDDAYCRVHGLRGKRADACGQSAPPTGAGPWYRMDDRPALDVAENAMLPLPQIGYVPLHVLYDETGTALDGSSLFGSAAFNTTSPDGALMLSGTTCGDWTSAATGSDVMLKNAYRAFENRPAIYTHCNEAARLVCVQRGPHGPALPRHLPSTARIAFVTSTVGKGDLSTWAAANGAVGPEGGDTICRSTAAAAGLPLADTYKAWLATAAGGAPARFVNDGPWYRTDGARVASSIADLADGTIDAPLQFDEAGRQLPIGFAWTGTNAFGDPGAGNCGDWRVPGARATFGYLSSADAFWSQFMDGPTVPCSEEAHLFCFGDNDSVFLSGFEP